MLFKHIKIIFLALIGAFFFNLTDQADAGTYKVIQCGAGIANDSSVTGSFVGSGLDIGQSCGATNPNQWLAAESGFLRFRTLSGGTTVPQNRNARYSFVMPDGLEIVSWSGYFKVDGEMSSGWRVRVVKVAADGTETIDKNMCTNSASCSGNNQLPIANIGWERKQTSAGSPFKELRLQLICTAAAGCSQSVGAADIKTNSFQFVVQDSINPTVTSVTGPMVGDFSSGSWVKGNQQVSLSGQDSQSGLYSARLIRLNDNATLATDTLGSGCSIYTNFLPELDGENGRVFKTCQTTPQQRTININTANLPSGPQLLSACLTDFSGNENCQPFLSRIDNIAPGGVSNPNPALSGNNLNVQTVAFDAQSGVEKVEYRVTLFSNQANVGSVTPSCIATTAPYGCDFNFSSYPSGSRVVIQARTYDRVGNISNETIAGPGSSGILIDKTPPEIILTSKPDSITNQTTAVFEFESDDPKTSYYCSLNGNSYKLCLSPTVYPGLLSGDQTFSFYGVDDLGNQSAPINYSWEIDTTIPTVEIDSAPTNPSSLSFANFLLTVDGQYSSVQCSLDGGDWADCSNPLEVSYTGLARGNHVFQTRAINIWNQPGPITSYAWQVLAPIPAVDIISGPAPLSDSSDAEFVFKSTSAAEGFQCRINDGAWENCDSPKTYADLSEGLHVFEVRAINSLGENGPESIYVWQIDTIVEPIVELVEVPQNPSPSLSARFAWDISGESIGSECSLDGASWGPCVSPVDYQGLRPGSHVFQVRALDINGVPGQPVSYSWLISASRPSVEIESGPPVFSGSDSAEFVFSSNELVSNYQCRIDGGTWALCSSPKNYTGLLDGVHIFEVRSLNSLGEPGDATPYAWTIDAVVEPVVEILSGPENPSSSSSAEFDFNVSGDYSLVVCSIDGGAFEPCASPVSYDGLRPGNHIFQARAIDTKERPGSIATYSWEIEATPPEALIMSGPEIETTLKDAEFVFKADSEVAGFECSLNGSLWQECESPKTYSGLSVGVQAFKVRAVDQFGNTGPSDFYAWNVLPTPLPIAEITSGPQTPSQSRSATFSFIVEGGYNKTECSIDGSAWDDCSSPREYNNLQRGSHLFRVRAVTESGEIGPPDNYGWEVATTYPDVVIDSAPESPTIDTSAEFTFSSNDDPSGYQCRIDNSEWESCASPRDYSGLGQGVHVFQVRALNDLLEPGDPAAYAWFIAAEDAPTVTLTNTPTNPSTSASAIFDFEVQGSSAGTECSIDGRTFIDCSTGVSYNDLSQGTHLFQVRATGSEGPGPVTSYSWVVKTGSATVDIISGPDTKTDSSNAEFIFEAVGEVSGFQCRLNGSGWDNCSSPQSYGGLLSGIQVFEVRALNTSGDPGDPAVYAWLIDNVAIPTVTITSAPSNPSLSNEATISFQVSGESKLTECSLDGSLWQPCSSPVNYTGLEKGNHVFAARAIGSSDAPGPISAYSWVIDSDIPEVEITAGPESETTSRVANFVFASTDSESFQCRIDGGPWAPCSSPKDYSGLDAGVHLFEVRALNDFNEPGPAASYPWVVVADALPVATITEKPPSPSSSSSADFSFSLSESAVSAECSLDGDLWAPCSSPVSYSGLANGTHVFQVRAVGSGGEKGLPASYSWGVDVIIADVYITGKPAKETLERTAEFSFSSDPEPSSYQCRIDGGEWAECSSPKTYSNLSSGVHVFEVRGATNNNFGNPAVYGWQIDTELPTVLITSSPSNPSASNSAEFDFAVSGDYEKTECSFDGGPWNDCESGVSYNQLTKGSHVFRVRAVNNFSEPGPEAIYGWQVTQSPATVEIISGPDSVSKTPAAEFVFEGNGADSFECRLNNNDWQACSSPKIYNDLEDGVYLFEVRGINSLGEPGEVARYGWVVDAVETPTVTLTSSPSNPSELSSASFSWDINGENTGSECSLDGKPFTPCNKDVSYSSLSNGNHIFQVRAVDTKGVPGPITTFAWVVNTDVPGIEIIEGPGSQTTATDATFVFRPDGPVAGYECRIDGGVWVTCDSPDGYQKLGLGIHIFQVRGVNQAGESGPETVYVWQIKEPDVAITLTQYPSNPSASPSATFNWDASGETEGFQCSINGSDFTGCQGPVTYNDLPSGGNVFQVRPILPGGETGPPLVYAWETKGPLIPVKITSAPGKNTNKKTAEFKFSAVGATGYQCRIDGGSWVTCQNPKSYSGLSDKNHIFEVRALNNFGDPGPAAVYSWVVDSAGRKCKISNIRSRLFIFQKQNVIRLVASYKASDPGRAVVYFYKRNKNGKAGKRVAAVSFRFSKSGNKKVVVRVRQKESLKKIKELRQQKRGFVAVADVKNAPGYCKSAFAKKMILTDKKIIKKQIVWFERGSFKK